MTHYRHSRHSTPLGGCSLTDITADRVPWCPLLQWVLCDILQLGGSPRPFIHGHNVVHGKFRTEHHAAVLAFHGINLRKNPFATYSYVPAITVDAAPADYRTPPRGELPAPATELTNAQPGISVHAPYQNDLHRLLTEPLCADVMATADGQNTRCNLCVPLMLLYNARQLASSESLRHYSVQLTAAMLQREVGCEGEMLTPAQQSELLVRTVTCCALVDKTAKLLVIIGMNDLARSRISVGVLETYNHVQSYWEAANQPGRMLDFNELCTLADENGLQVIRHCEGSRLWAHRPLGGDHGTPTTIAQGEEGLNTPSSRTSTSTRRTPVSNMLTSTRRFAGSNPPSLEEAP